MSDDVAATRLNFNKDGTLDEIVASGALIHLEQMNPNSYWMSIVADGVQHTIWFSAPRKITVSHEAFGVSEPPAGSTPKAGA